MLDAIAMHVRTYVINVGNLESTSQSLQESILHTPVQIVAKTTDSKLRTLVFFLVHRGYLSYLPVQ